LPLGGAGPEDVGIGEAGIHLPKLQSENLIPQDENPAFIEDDF
jgi:hypothetical protein